MICVPAQHPGSLLPVVAQARRRQQPWIVLAILIVAAALPTALLAAPPGGESEESSFGLVQPQTVLATFREQDDVVAEAKPVYRRPFTPPIDEDVVLASEEEVVQVPRPPAPPSNVPGAAQPPADLPGPSQPAAPPAAAATPQTPSSNSQSNSSNFLSSSIGTASTAQTTAPFMIGDVFGGNDVVINGLRGNASLGPVGGSLNFTGRVKLVENFSPMPRDRVFFDYNDFQNVPLIGGTTVSDLNRYSPGFEKTFFDRWASIEVRMPVAQTLNTTVSGVSLNNTHQGEFGDLFVSFKTLLWKTDSLAVSGGLSLSLPTANSVTFVNFPSVSLNQLQIQNRAVYLQPYLAFLWTPNDRFYMQSLFTTNFATNGSPVTVDFNGVAPQYLGRLDNQTLMNFSISAGYWAYRNPRGRYVTGVSPIFELHQSQTISNSNLVSITSGRGDVVTVGQTGYNFQLLNCTSGVNVQLGPLSSLLMAYTTPLGSGTDKQFSGEFRVLFNRRFGPQNRLTRSQF